MGRIGSDQGAQDLFGFPLGTQVIDHRPIDLTIKGDIQAVGAQGFDAIEISQIHLPQGLDLLWAKTHVAQGCLITLRQTPDGVE